MITVTRVISLSNPTASNLEIVGPDWEISLSRDPHETAEVTIRRHIDESEEAIRCHKMRIGRLEQAVESLSRQRRRIPTSSGGVWLALEPVGGISICAQDVDGSPLVRCAELDKAGERTGLIAYFPASEFNA
jgi:hypothetical protein